MENQVTVATTLRQAMLLRGLGQAWLARETGLTAKHVNQLFMGRAPLSVDVALRIERAVPAVSAEDLMVIQARDLVRAARMKS